MEVYKKRRGAVVVPVVYQERKKGFTMTMQINKSAAGNSAHKGWVMWWTLEQKSLLLPNVQQSAASTNIPGSVQSRIRGRSVKNAWRTATSLPAKGIRSDNIPNIDGQGTSSKYYVRTANENCRLVVRETLNSKLEVVDIDTVASLYFVGGDLQYSLQNSAIHTKEINAEVIALLKGMRQKFDDAIGKVDDAKIRELVIDWLHSVHRVCVRGTGGVYFIPRPTDSQKCQQVEQEIVAMTKWISAQPIGGLFSVIEVNEGGATNLDALADSALDEIKAELESMGDDMRKWSNNPKMNAGSRLYSASTILEKVSKLREKYESLRSSLGDKLQVAESMIDMVRNSAMGLQTSSSTEIQESRQKKEEETYGSLEDWQDVEIEVGESKPEGTGKKSGKTAGKKSGRTSGRK
jgi:hypothetical protein